MEDLWKSDKLEIDSISRAGEQRNFMNTFIEAIKRIEKRYQVISHED